VVSEPCHMSTETLLASPAALPPVPEKVGVESAVVEPSAGALRTGWGGWVSTVNVRDELRPVLPEASRCSASTV
jgi:hypothetical protein